jgi:hypothetical protein
VFEGYVVVAHDMQPMMADPEYLEAITSNPDLETIFLNKSLSGGVGVTLKKRVPREPSGEAAPAIGP